MSHLNIESLTLACRNREKEEQKRNNRKRTILLLVNQYLQNNGYVQTADALRSESGCCSEEYYMCDNIGLDAILQDFESYHFLRYQKVPIIAKKIPVEYIKKVLGQTSSNRCAKLPKDPNAVQEAVANAITGRTSLHRLSDFKDVPEIAKIDPALQAYTPEWTTLAKIILQDCFDRNSKVSDWSDVIGHSRAKQILKEAVIYPMKYSRMFPTRRTCWKSILLYGPSGTGKTLLAQVAAVKCQATFFKVCLSSLVSKWRGESEKLVKVLFQLARMYSPSIIFIDEMDSLMSHRGGDHEASRRMKTEFFLQMDAVASEENLFVLVLGASNLPWELDYAILRRMEKRMLVPLPNEESRVGLFKKFLAPDIIVNNNTSLENILDYTELAKVTDNYSASDIELVCKEVKMECIRRVIESMENDDSDNNMPAIETQPIQMSDVLTSVERTKPTSSHLVEKYNDWKNQHGSE